MDPELNGAVNTTEATPSVSPNQENVETFEDALRPKMTEEEFRVAVESQITRADTYWAPFKIKTRQATNYKYWVGDQVKASDLRDDLEKSVQNIIFQNIETYIPIVTSRVPEASVTPGYKNSQTRQYALNIKRVGQAEWEVYQLMPSLVARGIRNHTMNFLAVFQLGYDPDTDEFWTEEFPATDIVISKDGSFLARYIKNKDIGYLLDTFPDKKVQILDKLGYKSYSADSAIPAKIRQSAVEYLEAWTDEIVGWKLQELVLGVDNNPHWDYTGQEIVVGVDVNNQEIKKKVFFNGLKKPKKPFLFINYWNRGVHILDDTTILEQAIGPQDWVNKRKRQIGANADSTNGHWVSSGDFISKEEFDKIEGGVDEKIWLQSGKPQDGFIKLTGEPLPDYIYNDMVDSRMAIDHLMGIEQSTRGEQTDNKTLGQDVLQRNQNLGRSDGYVRDGIEKFAQQWYQYLYHMMLVYRTEEKAIAIPEDSDFESDNVYFSRDSVPLIKLNNGDYIPVPLIIRVKQGSTLPQDDAFEYNKAFQNRDKYSMIDYFKKMGEPNPRELAKNKLIETINPAFQFKDDPDIKFLMAQQDQAKQQALQEEQAKAQLDKESTISIEEAKADAQAKAKAAAFAGQQSGAVQPGAPQNPNSSATQGTNPADGPTAEGVSKALAARVEDGTVPADKVKEIMAAAQGGQGATPTPPPPPAG